MALLAGQWTRGLLLLQSVLQVKQLLREAGGRGGEQVSLLAELVDRVEEGRAEAGKCDEFRSQVKGVRARLPSWGTLTGGAGVR